MIWSTLLDAIVAVIDTVLGGLYALVPPVPGWLDGNALETVTGALGGLSAWIPLGLLFDVATSVVTAYLTAGTIGLTRAGLSHLTGGGGAS